MNKITNQTSFNKIEFYKVDFHMRETNSFIIIHKTSCIQIFNSLIRCVTYINYIRIIAKIIIISDNRKPFVIRN